MQIAVPSFPTPPSIPPLTPESPVRNVPSALQGHNKCAFVCSFHPIFLSNFPGLSFEFDEQHDINLVYVPQLNKVTLNLEKLLSNVFFLDFFPL